MSFVEPPHEGWIEARSMPIDGSMLSACGAVIVLFLLAWFLANRSVDADPVRIKSTD